MALANTIERYRVAKDQAWEWRREMGWLTRLTLAFGLACLIGVLAQVRMPLPWTPVPITGQTFGVLLAAVVLGRWWGGVSMAMYIGLGAAGVPWFNGASGGMASLAGPTGGFLIGFVLAALLVGFVVDKYAGARSFGGLLFIMLIADFILVFGPGLLQLNLWLSAAGKTVGFSQLLTMGLLPFIAGEVVKVVAAAGAAWALLGKQQSLR